MLWLLMGKSQQLFSHEQTAALDVCEKRKTKMNFCESYPTENILIQQSTDPSSQLVSDADA